MDEFKLVGQLAETLNDNGPHKPTSQSTTVGKLVDDLVARGEGVADAHDDFYGLKGSLPARLLGMQVEDVDDADLTQEEAAGVRRILEEGNTIISLEAQRG